MMIVLASAASMVGGYLAIVTLTLLWRVNLQATLGAQLKEEARINFEHTMLRQQCHYSQRLLDDLRNPARARAFYDVERN